MEDTTMKMNIRKITAAVMTATVLGLSIPITAGARTFGENGKFSTADATMILKHVLGIEKLTDDNLKAADVDGDGHITTKDATQVLREVIGLPEKEDSVIINGVKYDIATTTSLDLFLQDITNEDVVQIGKLKNLTVLDLHQTEISDISPLAGLTNLVELDLYNNQISDVSPLAGLKKLTTLNLGKN